MKAGVTVLFVALAISCVTAANRQLLQTAVPAPAPAPGNCPAPQSPGPDCAIQATKFQTTCGPVITALAQKTGGQATARTDSEIQTLVSGLGTSPSSDCCAAATDLLRNACLCNSAVQTLAKTQQNLSPSDLVLVGRTFAVACKFPTCTDTCRLPASSTG